MELDDAKVLAEAQVRMVLEEGGVMTVNRLAQVASDWSGDGHTFSQIMASLWEQPDGE